MWLFRWREVVSGKTVRKAVQIGTFAKYATKAAALKAVEKQGLRLKYIKELSGFPEGIMMRTIVQKYIAEKMPKRFSTSAAYTSYLNNYIVPRWGDCAVSEVKAWAVEAWLKELPLAAKSKTH